MDNDCGLPIATGLNKYCKIEHVTFSDKKTVCTNKKFLLGFIRITRRTKSAYTNILSCY